MPCCSSDEQRERLGRLMGYGLAHLTAVGALDAQPQRFYLTDTIAEAASIDPQRRVAWIGIEWLSRNYYIERRKTKGGAMTYALTEKGRKEFGA